jgi:nicotinic acid mononucleotide adenylyltransferase
MVLSIIFLEDKHNILLHLSIFYEYQQFFQQVEVAVVSRNRYGVEKTVDTHKILINAIQFYVCFQEI